MRRAPVLLATLAAACGTAEQMQLTAEPIAPPVQQPTVPPCDLQRGWIAPAMPVYGEQQMAVSPNRALLVRSDQFGAYFLRARDGAEVSAYRSSDARWLDGRWRRRAEHDGEGNVVVREVPSGRALMTAGKSRPPSEEDGWFEAGWPQLSADGARLHVVHCWSHPRTERRDAVLTTHDLDRGALVREVPLGAACNAGWSRPAIALSEVEGGRVLVLGLAGGVVLSVAPDGRVERGTIVFGEAAAAVLGMPRADDASEVLAAAFSADGSKAALTGRDGRGQVIDTRTFALLDAFEVGIGVANALTYLPSLESPIAFSPDGARIAHVAPDGRVVIRELAGGRTLAALDTPFSQTEEDLRWGGSPIDPAMSIELGAEGALVGYEGGVASWSCARPAETPPAAAPLEVRVSGPLSARVMEQVHLRVEVAGEQSPAVRRLEVGDNGWTQAGLDQEIVWTPQRAGTFTLAAFADDGISSGSAEITLEVR